MKRLKPTDVVVIGSGWSGLVMAKELTRRTALPVIVLERGPSRNISQYADGMDEINTRRVGLLQNPADQTITHRHSVKDRAAPIRQYGAFMPGTGTGGEATGNSCVSVILMRLNVTDRTQAVVAALQRGLAHL